MALKKIKQIKGVDVDYWKIINCDVKTGIVIIAPFANKESAKKRDNMFDGMEMFQIDFPVKDLNPIAFAYAKIKESKKESRVVEEQIVEVETNWFADSVDC
jgi:hypothetical protein